MNFTPNTLAAALAPFASHGERKRARRAPKQRATVAPSPILCALVSRVYAPIPGNPRAAVVAFAAAAPWHGIGGQCTGDAMRDAALAAVRNPAGV